MVPAEAVAGDPATTAAAVVAVRTAAAADLYVDTAIVDGATAIAGVTLVGVRAVVVPRTAQGWGAPATVRYVVPVGPVAGIPTALAEPWRVPVVRAAAPQPALTPAGSAVKARAVTAALTSAGYTQVTDLRLRQSAALPDVVIADLRAVAPADPSPRAHRVWLGGDPLRVLGVPTPVDLPVPEEEP